MEKKTHFGRAGEFAAMSEFLLRGYNVAVPTVDVGDDAFVIDDLGGATWRVQVKTGDGAVATKDSDSFPVLYKLSREQLRAAKPTELFFMFMVRWQDRWRYILVPRVDLLEIREKFVEAGKQAKRRGPKPKSDAEAKGDGLSIVVTWSKDDAQGWGVSFKGYLAQWPETLPPITSGPGATNRGASR